MTFKDFIEPFCLILIPVLYIIGLFLKNAQRFPDKDIPLMLGGAGILLACLVVLTSCPWPTTGQEWLNAVCSALLQGVLCAGCAVYADQIFKQAGKPTVSPLEYMSKETAETIRKEEEKEAEGK